MMQNLKTLSKQSKSFIKASGNLTCINYLSNTILESNSDPPLQLSLIKKVLERNY